MNDPNMCGAFLVLNCLRDFICYHTILLHIHCAVIVIICQLIEKMESVDVRLPDDNEFENDFTDDYNRNEDGDPNCREGYIDSVCLSVFV